jgi:hypothetical protein
MAQDFMKSFGNIALIGLVLFSILSFIIITENDNGVDNGIMSNNLINSTYNDLYGNLSETQSNAQTSSDTFGSITPSQQYGELEVTSVVSPTRIFKTMSIGLWNIFIQLPMKILGVSPVIASVISSIIILLLIIGVWAIWKGVINVS